MKEFIIKKSEEGQRLDRFLKRIMPEANDSFLCRMIRKKNIKVNDKGTEPGIHLNAGDDVKVYFSDETFEKFEGAANHIDIQSYKNAYRNLKGIIPEYEDDNMVIFYKPSGILSQRSKKDESSLNEYLIGYLLENGSVDDISLKSFRPSVLNRLDRNTDGLVICSKTIKGAEEISYLIRERKIKKYYKTVCKGRIDKAECLEGYLLKDEKTNTVKVFKNEQPGASKIKTRISPVSFYDDRTEIEVELITGKTHQIRAHLASIDHPILGDTKYGDMKFNRKYDTFIQKLTAYRIVFPDDCNIDDWRGLIVRIQ